jgi:hypothetical protein
MPEPTKSYQRSLSKSPAGQVDREGISIAEAKAGLAIYFDVPVDAINITISG